MKRKVSVILTIIAIVLSTIASLGGLFWKSLYNDNPFVASVWFGNDVITVLLVIPIAIISLMKSRKKSITAKIVWAGILWYLIYNYTFYMFGAAFNEFFLLYVFIFILSLVAFIVVVSELLAMKSLQAVIENPNLPVKRIGLFMLFFSTFIGSIWILMSLSYIFTQEVPVGITQTGHPTGVVFATDLSLLVTPLIIGAILLIKRHYLGFIISSIIMVKCLLYPLVLLVGGVIASKNTGHWDPFIPAYLTLGLGCFICLNALFKGMKIKTP